MVDHGAIGVLLVEENSKCPHTAGVLEAFREQKRRSEMLYSDWSGHLKLLVEQLDRLHLDQLRDTEHLIGQALQCEVSPLTSLAVASGSNGFHSGAEANAGQPSASSGEHRWSRQPPEQDTVKPTGSVYEGAVYEGAIGAVVPGRFSPTLPAADTVSPIETRFTAAPRHSVGIFGPEFLPGATGSVVQPIESVFAGSAVRDRITVEAAGATDFEPNAGDRELVVLPGDCVSLRQRSAAEGSADDGAGCGKRGEPLPAWEATAPQDGVPRTTTPEVDISDAVKVLLGDDDEEEYNDSKMLRRSCTSAYSHSADKNGFRDDSPPLLPLLASWVFSTKYQVFCSLVIIINIIFVGASAQYALDASVAVLNCHERDVCLVGKGKDIVWAAQERSLDIVFCIWFGIESILNFVANPRRFVYGDSWKWNFFDVILELNYILDLVLQSANVKILNVGDYLRTLRVFRTARVLRILRVFRVFASLRLMVVAIVQSLTSLLWVFLLLVVVMYVFAIFFLNAADEYVNRSAPAAWAVTDLRNHYGSVLVCLWSLFKAISGGIDWQDLVSVLLEVDRVYACIFAAYIFFVVFGVVNVVTGAFVDNFAVVSQRDRDTVIEEELRREHKYIDDMQHMFEGADTDKSGMLTMEEFEHHLQNPRVKAFFTTLELDVSQARSLFTLLDTDGTNEVGIDEFVQGCMRLKGEAKSIDVNMLLYQNEYIMFKINAFSDQVNVLQVLAGGASSGPSPQHSAAAKVAVQENECGAGTDGSVSPSRKVQWSGSQRSNTSPATSPSQRQERKKSISKEKTRGNLSETSATPTRHVTAMSSFSRAAHTTAMVNRLGHAKS